MTAKPTKLTPMSIRFLYNGNEVIFPGHDTAWMTLEDVNNKLLHCATPTPTPISTSTSTDKEKEESSPTTGVPELLHPPSSPPTRSKL